MQGHGGQCLQPVRIYIVGEREREVREGDGGEGGEGGREREVRVVREGEEVSCERSEGRTFW